MAACMYCAGTGLSMGLGTGWVPCPEGCPPRRQPWPGTRPDLPRDAVTRGIDQMIASFRNHRRTHVRVLDARCEKCGKRIGWFGEVKEQPTCGRCGHKPDPAKLKAAQKEMDDFQKLLADRAKNRPAEVHRRQRAAAGLSLNQAAKMLGLRDGYALARIERGEESPPPELADRMADLYGIDSDDPPESS